MGARERAEFLSSAIDDLEGCITCLRALGSSHEMAVASLYDIRDELKIEVEGIVERLEQEYERERRLAVADYWRAVI